MLLRVQGLIRPTGTYALDSNQLRAARLAIAWSILVQLPLDVFGSALAMVMSLAEATGQEMDESVFLVPF